MIFRTGSVLIVGMCEENVLNDIYAFLTRLLKTEFEHICQSLIEDSQAFLKDKKKKVRRKVVMIMTTVEPILEVISDAVCSDAVCSNATSSNAISSNIIFEIEEDVKEPDTLVEKRVKRSYNKKKPITSKV